MLDTGVGVAVVSRTLCERAKVSPNGRSYAGKRMSGQRIETPLATVPSLAAGSFRREQVTAGVFDLSGFFPPDSGIEGILPVQFFEPWPFSINSVTRTIRVDRGEPAPDSLKTPVEAPIEVRRDGPSVAIFLDLKLPSGTVAHVEVDTGSDSLILHRRYMGELGVDPNSARVRRRESTDETGNRYTRFFSNVPGQVSVAAASSVVQNDPPVMFQDIIYDGLVGDSFLRSYEVTYDIARSRLLFADPA
jgi:hypothetical protein